MSQITQLIRSGVVFLGEAAMVGQIGLKVGQFLDFRPTIELGMSF